MIVITVVAIVMALLVTNIDNLFRGVEYVYERKEVIKEVEVTPDWAKDEEAVQAAKDVIRKKELQSELKNLDAQIKELQDKRKTLSKELDGY